MGSRFTGRLLLALDGDKFRIELMDKTGRVIQAVAGGQGQVIRINPQTGERSLHTGDTVPITSRITAPVSFMRTLVTGEAPKFSSIKSASAKNGYQIVKVDGPAMEITYSDRIEQILHHTKNGSSVALRAEPMVEGSLAPYSSGAEISSGAVTIKVKWQEVMQGMEFDKGFFEFDSF